MRHKSSKQFPTEKIQKILARHGMGSRREIETWIERGQVKVNGKVAKLGDRANLTDRFHVRGQLIRVSTKGVNQAPRVIVYNKPEGEICTRNDPEGRKTVFASLPKLSRGRWIAVGRLDINSSGLLLFTDNGELANKLMHPSSEIEREYSVRILGKLDRELHETLTGGVNLEDGIAAFDQVKPAGGTGINQWYNVVLKEGRNREIRRMFEAIDKQVSRLIRIRFGKFMLPRNLRQGHWVDLSEKDIEKLA